MVTGIMYHLLEKYISIALFTTQVLSPYLNNVVEFRMLLQLPVAGLLDHFVELLKQALEVGQLNVRSCLQVFLGSFLYLPTKEVLKYPSMLFKRRYLILT